MSSNTVPSATRQRTISFSEVSTSDQTRALVYLLNTIDAATFVQRLLDVTRPENGYTADDISCLTDALKGVGFERSLAQAERAVADDTTRHCVRCHHSYLERENRNDACVIRHSYPFSMASAPSSSPPSSLPSTLTSRVKDDDNHKCVTCKKVVPMSSVVDQVCVATRHTTNPANLSPLRNSKIIRTCDEVGCFKAVVTPHRTKDDEPPPFSFGIPFPPEPTNPIPKAKGPESWTGVPSSGSENRPNGTVGSESTEDLNSAPKSKVARHDTCSPSPSPQSSSPPKSSSEPKVESQPKVKPAVNTKNATYTFPKTGLAEASAPAASSAFIFSFGPPGKGTSNAASPKPQTGYPKPPSGSGNRLDGYSGLGS